MEEITVAKYHDRRVMTVGRAIPTGNVQMYAVTRVSSDELRKIMEAKPEEVQKILESFI